MLRSVDCTNWAGFDKTLATSPTRAGGRLHTSLTHDTFRVPSCTSTRRCSCRVLASSQYRVGPLSLMISDAPSVAMPQPSCRHSK